VELFGRLSMTTAPVPPELLDAVVEYFRPLRVILFGLAMEDEPEPVPDDADLRHAFDIVAELAERLQRATASEHRKPGPNAGPEAG
jgi:hypothetical protein